MLGALTRPSGARHRDRALLLPQGTTAHPAAASVSLCVWQTLSFCSELRTEVLVLSCGCPRTHGALALIGLPSAWGAPHWPICSLFRPPLRRDPVGCWSTTSTPPQRGCMGGPRAAQPVSCPSRSELLDLPAGPEPGGRGRCPVSSPVPVRQERADQHQAVLKGEEGRRGQVCPLECVPCGVVNAGCGRRRPCAGWCPPLPLGA